MPETPASEFEQREAELARRSSAGDVAALTVLLTEGRRRLVAYIASRIPARLRSEVDAEDIVQTALIPAYREIGRFDYRGPGSFQRWIATIALRKLRDALRLRRATRRGGGERMIGGGVAADDSMIALLDGVTAPGRSPSKSLARNEAIATIRKAMEGLPEDYRRALWLVSIEGRSVAEAAAAMGRTERAIHNLCHKARQRLGELLGSFSRF